MDKIAIIRDPFERIVSEYFWQHRNKPNVSTSQNHFEQWLISSLNEYKKDIFYADNHFRPQAQYIDESCKIFHIKDLDSLSNYIKDKLNIKCNFSNIKNKSKKSKVDYPVFKNMPKGLKKEFVNIYKEDYKIIESLDKKLEIDINFSSESRIDLISYFIKKTNCQSYLEIGCDKNQVWNTVNVPFKNGVDPARGGNLRMTSDEFFKTNSNKFDVIFLDGLHTYDQVMKDINNSLKVLNSEGVIIIHDMLPITKNTANPNIIPKKGPWLGDVYRASFDLSNRKDIFFRLVLIDQGCGIITKEKNSNPQKFIKADWDYYAENYKKLPLVTYKSIIKNHN